jgi:hypothetical protein
MDANHTQVASGSGSDSDSADAQSQAVVGVLKQFIHDGVASESIPRKDGLSMAAAETQMPTAAIRRSVGAPMITAKALCEICSNIHFRRLWDCGFPESKVKNYLDRVYGFGLMGLDKFYYIHHKSKDALEVSAKNGCHFCIMLWRALSDPKVESSQPWRGIEPRPPGDVLMALEGPRHAKVSSSGSIPIQVKCADRVIEGRIGPTYQGTIACYKEFGLGCAKN